MRNIRLFQMAIALLAILQTAAARAVGDERTAADILPASTVIYAEIRQPEVLLTSIYDHDLVRRFEALDQVRAAMEKKEYLDARAAVAIVESQMGLPWRKIIGPTLGGGIVFAIDAKTNAGAVMARATDGAAQAKLLEVVTNLAMLDAKQKGKPEPIKAVDYRGIKTYTDDKGMSAATGNWLVITNKDDFGKRLIDHILDSPKDSLAEDPQFAKARQGIGPATPVWAYANIAALREGGMAKKLFDGKADNPLVELVFGGLLGTLAKTPYATVAIDANDRQLRMMAAAPHDRNWAGETREYYFGPQGTGRAPARLSVDQMILSSSSYRDIAGMWLKADDLFDKQTNEEIAKAESGLSTLFGGKDFGQDILGAIRPETQFVVARQAFAEGQPTPAIKLPAFGLVAELKDPVKMQPDLRRTFQSLIGFFNIVGAMNGQPQLDLDMEKATGAQFVTASYLADPSAKEGRAVKINYNFSPTIGFTGSRFVLASTKDFAHQLTTATPAKHNDRDENRVVNGEVLLQFNTLRDALADNRGQLVAQNMLTEGHGKEEAEKKIGELLELVDWFDRLELSLDSSTSELRVLLTVGLKANP